jgi:hypothetical protein
MGAPPSADGGPCVPLLDPSSVPPLERTKTAIGGVRVLAAPSAPCRPMRQRLCASGADVRGLSCIVYRYSIQGRMWLFVGGIRRGTFVSERALHPAASCRRGPGHPACDGLGQAIGRGWHSIRYALQARRNVMTPCATTPYHADGCTFGSPAGLPAMQLPL